MKVALLFIVIGFGSAARAEECRSSAKELTELLKNPLLQFVMSEKGWKDYKPLLNGGKFEAAPDKRVALVFRGRSLEGEAVCIDIPKKKLYVKDGEAKTDARSLLEEKRSMAYHADATS